MELCCAALTLIRGRLNSTAPRARGRMASFEAWDDLVRQTICWIGTEVAPGEYGDPLDLVRRAQGSDPEQESLFALLEALDDLFRCAWFTAKEVSQRASRGRTDAFASAGETALAEALADLGGERALGSTKSVGRILQFREGRIVFGLRLLSRSGRSGREYRVDAVGGPDRCGFGGFGGFKSSNLEKDVAGRDLLPAIDATKLDSEWPESNPPNPLNPQAAGSDVVEDR